MKPADLSGSTARLSATDSPSFGGTAGLGDTTTSIHTLTSLNHQEPRKYCSRASTAQADKDDVTPSLSFHAGTQARMLHGLDGGSSATFAKFSGFQPRSSPLGQAPTGKAALHSVVGSDDASVSAKNFSRSQTITQFPGKSDDSVGPARTFHKSATTAFERQEKVPHHEHRPAMEKHPGKSMEAIAGQTEVRQVPTTAGRQEDLGPIVSAAVPNSFPDPRLDEQQQQQTGQQQPQQQLAEQLRATEESQRRAELMVKLKEKDATINNLKLKVEELRLQRVTVLSDYTRRIDQLDKIITSSNITPDITVKAAPTESKENISFVPGEPNRALPDFGIKSRSVAAAPAMQLPVFSKPSEQNTASFTSAYPRMDTSSVYKPRLNGVFPVHRPPPPMCHKDYKNVPRVSCMDPARVQTYDTQGPLSLGAFSREFNLFKTETGEAIYVDRKKEHKRWQELELEHRHKVTASIHGTQTGFPSMMTSFFTWIS